MADAVMTLQNDPMTLESFARSVGPTDFTRQAASLAFARLAAKQWHQAAQAADRGMQWAGWGGKIWLTAIIIFAHACAGDRGADPVGGNRWRLLPGDAPTESVSRVQSLL